MLTSTIVTQVLISGLLIGLVFSLVAIGLTLIFGVMDIVNFAHGEFLMLSMYIAFWMWTLWGVDPVFSIPMCTATLFLLGIFTYKSLVSRIMNAPMLAQIMATFGLMVFLQSAAFFLWKGNYRTINGSIISGRVEVLGAYIGIPQMIAALGAVVATGAVALLINRTELGRALRATAEDREAAALMGINTEWMFCFSWGLGAACAGVAGALLSTFYPVFPLVGGVFVLTTCVVVVLGGFGSIAGAFIAGIIVGLVQVLSGFFVTPAFKQVFVYAIYLVVVFIRPKGLMGK